MIAATLEERLTARVLAHPDVRILYPARSALPWGAAMAPDAASS